MTRMIRLALLAFVLSGAHAVAQVSTLDVLDKDSVARTIRTIPALGPQLGTASRSVVFATDATLPAFAATPAFTISGTLPAFAATPAFTISGTLPAFAAVPAFKIDQTTPGTTNLVQVGGTLPAFAAAPTVNLGTLGGAATETTLAAFSGKVPASLGAKAGAASFSIVPASDATFASTQSGVWTVVVSTASNVKASGASSGVVSGFGAATNYVAGRAIGGIQTVSVTRAFTSGTELYGGTLARAVLGVKSGSITSPVLLYIFDACPISGATACGVASLTGTLGATCTDNVAYAQGTANPYLVDIAVMNPAVIGGGGTASRASVDMAVPFMNQDLVANGGVGGLPTRNLYVCAVAGASGVDLSTQGANALWLRLAVDQN